MKGFPGWRDVPDFINGITYEIWEGRRIGALSHLYAPGLIVRSPASILRGNDGVIAATLATLAEFPDRELLGEDVIWRRVDARCDAGSEAFLSSHRLLCTATHAGPGMYGAPTGRRLAYRILADCSIKAGAVDDEWLVRDQGAIVRQMGWSPKAWTRDLIAREGARPVAPYRPEDDTPGPYAETGDAHDAADALAGALRAAMAGDLSVISKTWDRASALHYPGHITATGPDQADRFWLGLRAAFPSARLAIHHVMGRDDPAMPPRAAIRWSLDGAHDGFGPFGPPTGAHVHVMGITHAEIGSPAGAGLVRREWTLIDETAIWKQILLATGAADLADSDARTTRSAT